MTTTRHIQFPEADVVSAGSIFGLVQGFGQAIPCSAALRLVWGVPPPVRRMPRKGCRVFPAARRELVRQAFPFPAACRRCPDGFDTRPKSFREIA